MLLANPEHIETVFRHLIEPGFDINQTLMREGESFATKSLREVDTHHFRKTLIIENHETNIARASIMIELMSPTGLMIPDRNGDSTLLLACQRQSLPQALILKVYEKTYQQFTLIDALTIGHHHAIETVQAMFTHYISTEHPTLFQSIDQAKLSAILETKWMEWIVCIYPDASINIISMDLMDDPSINYFKEAPSLYVDEQTLFSMLTEHKHPTERSRNLQIDDFHLDQTSRVPLVKAMMLSLSMAYASAHENKEDRAIVSPLFDDVVNQLNTDDDKLHASFQALLESENILETPSRQANV